MIEFCDCVARNIRSAKTVKEVDEIIGSSFTQFVERKGNSHPSTFAMNMIVTLQFHGLEANDKHELSNVDYGIAMYREQQINRATQLF